ncbi:Probable RNA-directed DNA polymerase from transposon X-element [Eumeta japonica]|uniref:Probable RNA-directed DNA polymerase from transposon X-element n=1 Tax=Eumeta variegata TaxID=151549 RepID=A0A4C1UM03_EUMVA|nr:Probable RNA-directed DNA polymerase from transposon X-element [Eumeta japonica]
MPTKISKVILEALNGPAAVKLNSDLSNSHSALKTRHFGQNIGQHFRSPHTRNHTRKAPGLVGISNKAIKCFSIPLLSLLVAIFNVCIKKCYFTPAWKEAEFIGIHKPGKPRDLLASYRPISLLSGLGKLFEKILKTRLSDHLLGKGLIIDEQFGFRPAHSCPASPPLSRVCLGALKPNVAP